MSLSATSIDAKIAELWGILVAVKEPEDLLSSAIAIASQVASLNSSLVSQYKVSMIT